MDRGVDRSWGSGYGSYGMNRRVWKVVVYFKGMDLGMDRFVEPVYDPY